MDDPEGWGTIEKALSGDTVSLAAFREFLTRAENPDLDALFEEVDQSDYSLPDWISAFLTFDRWMTEQKREARPFRGMMGYIHCCTLMNATQVSLASLNVIVGEALTDYGFDEVNVSQL